MVKWSGIDKKIKKIKIKEEGVSKMNIENKKIISFNLFIMSCLLYAPNGIKIMEVIKLMQLFEKKYPKCTIEYNHKLDGLYEEYYIDDVDYQNNLIYRFKDFIFATSKIEIDGKEVTLRDFIISQQSTEMKSFFNNIEVKEIISNNNKQLKLTNNIQQPQHIKILVI